MARVRVVQPHALTPQEAVARMASFEEMMGKYGARATWSGTVARVRGTGVTGTIEVGPREVVVTLELGLLARAAGVDPVRLQGSIARRLVEAFGP